MAREYGVPYRVNWTFPSTVFFLYRFFILISLPYISMRVPGCRHWYLPTWCTVGDASPRKYGYFAPAFGVETCPCWKSNQLERRCRSTCCSGTLSVYRFMPFPLHTTVAMITMLLPPDLLSVVTPSLFSTDPVSRKKKVCLPPTHFKILPQRSPEFQQ